MHPNLAIILLQFYYGKNSVTVLVPVRWTTKKGEVFLAKSDTNCSSLRAKNLEEELDSFLDVVWCSWVGLCTYIYLHTYISR